MPGSDDAQGDPAGALDRAEMRRSGRTLHAASVAIARLQSLVERYQSAAYGLALRMLGDPDAAADVTQDAFFSAFRKIRSFRGASFRAWLLRIVSNGCYDYWRAQRRRPAESLDALLNEGDDALGAASATGQQGAEPALTRSLDSAAWDPEGAALRAEVIAAIEAAILRWSPDQRLVIILSDIQGLSYEEVARITDDSTGNGEVTHRAGAGAAAGDVAGAAGTIPACAAS